MNDNSFHHPSWAWDPVVHGYWVVPGRLLAAEYPGSTDPRKAAVKRAVLLEAGITSFVDLTETGEPAGGGLPMRPYGTLMIAEGADRGIAARYARFGIPDTGIIDDAGYDEILAHITTELDNGCIVLAHCWGGKGRTGTVVGSWLIDTEGVGYPEVIDRIQELRRGTRKAHHPVPDTEAQHDVLRRRAQRRGA